MSSCVRFNDDQPEPGFPVKHQPKRIDTVQLPRPPLSLSVFLPLIDTSLTLTEMERKREQEAGPFESGLVVVGGVMVGGLFV